MEDTRVLETRSSFELRFEEISREYAGQIRSDGLKKLLKELDRFSDEDLRGEGSDALSFALSKYYSYILHGNEGNGPGNEGTANKFETIIYKLCEKLGKSPRGLPDVAIATFLEKDCLAFSIERDFGDRPKPYLGLFGSRGDHQGRQAFAAALKASGERERMLSMEYDVLDDSGVDIRDMRRYFNEAQKDFLEKNGLAVQVHCSSLDKAERLFCIHRIDTEKVDDVFDRFIKGLREWPEAESDGLKAVTSCVRYEENPKFSVIIDLENKQELAKRWEQIKDDRLSGVDLSAIDSGSVSGSVLDASSQSGESGERDVVSPSRSLRKGFENPTATPLATRVITAVY